MSFVTTCMKLEGIILSEINQTKTNIVWYNLMWNLKKSTHESEWWLPETEGGGSGDMLVKGITSIYKISSRDQMYSTVTLINILESC